MLKTERRDAVLLLTLNRPEKHNALHPDLICALADELKRAEVDESLAVVVITGAGNSFCAGIDLNHLLGLGPEGRIDYMRTAFDLFGQLYRLPQPVIAAVNGPAMAGGFDLAAFCDLRYCSPQASFAQTEVLLGITQIMHPLYKIIGLGRAKESAFTGEPMSAEEAYRIGLVNRIHPQAELLSRTLEFAVTLASRPRQALFETKRLSRELIDLDTESAMKLMFEAICQRLRSDEHQQEAEEFVARMRNRK
jgi:enoyl-CoA hydratase/carnithine racemase